VIRLRAVGCVDARDIDALGHHAIEYGRIVGCRPERHHDLGAS
jgi:hypothetical protein